MTVKFVWNGIKIDGEFFKGHYYSGPYTEASKLPDKTITIYIHGYKSLPEIDGLNVENDSDIMTDYFEEDRVRIFPNTQYYEDACKAAKACEIHSAKRSIKHFEKMLAKRIGTHYEDFYRQELEDSKSRLSALMA